MTRRGADSVDGLAEDFSGRLTALSNVHSVVFNAGGEEAQLNDIIDATVAAYRVMGRSNIKTGGPDILVPRSVGTTLALCMHELATNAIKYGALSRPEGQITLTWQLLRFRPAPDNHLDRKRRPTCRRAGPGRLRNSLYARGVDERVRGAS